MKIRNNKGNMDRTPYEAILCGVFRKIVLNFDLNSKISYFLFRAHDNQLE